MSKLGIFLAGFFSGLVAWIGFLAILTDGDEQDLERII